MRKIADLVIHSDARGADSPEFGHLRGSGMAKAHLLAHGWGIIARIGTNYFHFDGMNRQMARR